MKESFNPARLFFIILVSIVFFSCSDEETDIETDYDYDKQYVDNQPTEDEMKTSFEGKVALLYSNNDAIMPFLMKRFTNTTDRFSDDVDVVILDEERAQTFIEDENKFKVLKKYWNTNKVILFIDPSNMAITLEKKLKQLNNDTKTLSHTSKELDQFKDIHIYVTRADGASLFHEDTYDPNESVEVSIQSEKEGNLQSAKEIFEFTSKPNDYNMGKEAENIISWLKDYALLGEQRDVSFTRTDQSYSVTPTPITRYFSVTANHDWFKQFSNENATVPNPTTVDVKAHLDIYGTFSTTRNCDVYDINLYQEFPANKTFIKDVYVYEKAAYNYKYTGGCYYGPEIELMMNNIPASSIEVEQVAPLPQTGGQYNNTHYPMQLGFGTSLQGNLSTEPGLSAGLSMSCQLPYTTMSFNHAEMPIDFSNDNKHAKWKYSTDYDIYRVNWGFNPKFIDVPDVVKSFCKTDQAVTFIVNNTQSFGSKEMGMKWNAIFRIYSEYADPWTHWSNVYSKKYTNIYIKLPSVNRYFEKYTPYPLPGYGGSGDSDEWGNLEQRLMRNINYRALCDETLKVGAQTLDGLDPTAENIWRTAIESIVLQYDGTTTNNEYVIGLARSNGSHIQLGLHIKDGIWRLVDNVDDLPNKKINSRGIPR